MLARFFRNPDTGELVLFQAPNLPLWIYLFATAARLIFEPEGTPGTLLSFVTRVALVVWAVLEIVDGDSPFRRALGGTVLLGVVVSLLIG